MLIAALIILQLLIFAILIFVFRKILTQNVVFATKHLDELNQDYNEKEKKLGQQLQDADSKAKEIVEKAEEEALKSKNQILQDAQSEKDKIIKSAHLEAQELIQQADKSRQQLLLELDERIAKESINKACELIQDILPEEFKLLVHTHWVQDLLKNDFTQLKSLRLPEGVNEARLVTAFKLKAEELNELAKKLNKSLGSEIKLVEEIDPKIVAGVVISIGSLVLDGSLKNKIKEKARR